MIVSIHRVVTHMVDGGENGWAGRQLLITQRLRQRRAELGLTQKQVVTRLGRCGLATTNRTLSSLEHGAGIDVAKLPELAAALDCTITYLVGLTDDPYRWEPESPAAARRASGTGRRSAPSPDSAERRAGEFVERGYGSSLIMGDVIPDRGLHLGSERPGAV